MKFSITRQNLHRGLASVSATIPSKTTLPVLSNILLETSEEGVQMSGTDLDVSIRIRVPADVSEGGTLTVPGKKLQEIARELPDEIVEVVTSGERIVLSCGRSRFKLNGLSSEEFPNLPQIHFEEGWGVMGKDLHDLAQHTAFAVSAEESRPILNGVLWQLGDGRMQMVATNGHRLARMAVAAGPSDAPSSEFLLPPAALQQVRRLFEDDDDIQVARNGNHLGFRSGSAEVYTRLIEGTYPNYEKVIPTDNDKTATVDRSSLEAAVRRMAVVASDQTHRIRLKFEEGSARLSVLTPDLGEGRDELEIQYEGEELEIGFNATYLLEVLRYMPTDEVTITLKHPERAATFEPQFPEGEEKKVDYLCLVMPLRLLD